MTPTSASPYEVLYSASLILTDKIDIRVFLTAFALFKQIQKLVGCNYFDSFIFAHTQKI